MVRGKPRITCKATAKSTGRRCGKAPVPGAAVCRLHGANRAVRAKGQQRLAEAKIRQQLEKWEKAQTKRNAIHEAAVAPWTDEPVIKSSVARRYAEPADLRRIATEMRDVARELMSEAKAIEQRRRSAIATES